MAYKTSNEYKKYIYSEDSEHSLDIIINGITINNDFVGEITLDDQVFNDSDFTLGSAIPCKIILSLHNEVVDEFDSVKEISFNYKLIIEEKEEIIPLGTYTVEKTECSSDDYTRYTLYDYMKKFDAEWDASKYMPCTRYELYSHMCEDFKIKKGSSSFINGNVIMDVYDSEYKARDYLIYISERAGGFAKVIRDELIIKSLGDVDEVNISDGIIGEYSTDDKKKITKVVYANAIQRFEKGTDDGITIYLSQESPLSCTQEEVDNIFNSLNGLEYQSLDVEVWGDPSIDTGDVIRVGNFISFAQKYWTFGNGFYGNYRTKLKNITSGVNTNKVSEKTKRKRLEAKLNEVEGTIDLVSEQVDNIDKEIITNKQASGNPIEVDDAGEYELESIAIEGKSYQEGTPTPTNPQEIETVQGITNILDNNHYTDKANIGTSNGLDLPGINIIRFDAYNRCKENTYIYFSKILCAYFYDKNKNFISSVTDRSEKILTPKNTYYARFRTYSSEYTTFKNTDYVVSYTPNPSIIPSGRWLEQITYSKNNAIFDESYKSNSYTYNSFDADNISVVKNATGGIFYARYKLDIRKAGDYIISSESNINHQIYVYRDALWGSLVKWVYTGGESEITFEEAGTYILGVFANSSTTGAEFQIQNLMVRKKTIEDSSYAKYKMNSALIDMNKPNLFDGELEVGALSGNDGTDAQVTIRLRSKNFIKLTPNSRYPLKYNEDNIKYNIFYFDKNKTYISNLGSWLTNKDTFVVPNNVEYVRFVFHNSDYPNINMQVSDISNIQLYEGYDPYYEFSSTNEVKDIFDNGNLIKKTNKVILTENDAWILSPNYSNLFVMKNKPADLKMQEIDLVSSIGYKVVNNTGQINANDYCIYIGNDINIKCKDYTTLEEFKNYLKNNPITIFYPSTSPQIYELSYERLKLHKGYNYITLNDDLYPNMEITYLTNSTLNAQYTTHAQLKIEKDKISTEVEASTKYLGEEIESTKSQITQEAGAIRGEVNDKFKDYSTTAQTNAAINVAIENHDPEIELSVSKKIEDIQIGASNLVLDSAKEREIAVEGAHATNRISVTPGEEIAVSFDVKGASVYTGNIALMEYYQNDTTATRYSYLWITGSVKTSWNRIEKIITVPKDVYSIDFGYRSSSNVKNSFRNVQIERGNKVTSYRPSSEDYSTTQEVNGKLELKVGNNEYNKIVSMLNAAADEINFKGGSKINITTAGKLIISAGNFQLDASGNIKATGGTIGGWEISKNYLFADTIIGNNLYRTYLQPVLKAHEKDTWVFSIQKGENGATDLDGIFNVLSNGDIETIGNIHATGVISNSGGFQTDHFKYSNYGIIPPVQVTTSTSSESIPSGQQFELGSVTLDQGYYVGVCRAWFTGNATGYRAIGIVPYADPKFNSQNRWISVPGCNASEGQSVMIPIHLTSGKEQVVKLMAYQNSGKALSISSYISLYRIK